MTIPNAMSLLRIILIPLIVWLYCGAEQYLWAVIVTAFSALTDIADGKIARHYNMVSDFGKVLDPIADKLTQIALMICLLSRYPWLWILIVLFVVKEFLMMAWGYLALKLTNSVNSAQWYGKLSTVTLYAVMMFLFLFPNTSENLALVLILVCVTFMLLSLIMYGHFYRGILTEDILGDRWEKISERVWHMLLLVVWVGIIIALAVHKGDFTVDKILNYAPSNPILTSLIMMCLFALKSLSVFLYCGILYTANGFLFSLPVAIILNVLGTIIMVSIPYFIGKNNGTKVISQITKKNKKMEHLREFRQQNDFLFVLFSRLVGFFPCDIVSLYMGALNVNYWKYMFGCVLGLLPEIVIFPIMGLGISDLNSPVFLSALGVRIVFIAISAALCSRYKKSYLKKEQQISES